MPKETFFNLDSEKQNRIIDAALTEFETNSYEEGKLSRIIKASNIPRGSFYQYFADKKDLYMYLFQLMTEKKLGYMSDILPNPENTPFVDLFMEIYFKGLHFAKDNPRYIKVARNLFNKRGEMFDLLLKDGLKQAKEYYVSYLEADKKLGRIREDVDVDMLADFVISTTSTVAFEDLADKDTLDEEKLIKRINSMIQILKKGIE